MRCSVVSAHGARHNGGVLSILSCVLGLLLAACGAAAEPGGDSRPDVLLLVSDDQGVVLGCYGTAGVQTPNLDALAARGRRFTRAYATSGVCTPSRTSLYTGLNPVRSGATGFGPVGVGVRVWGEHLSAAGYRTGLIGKLGAKPIARFPFDFIERTKKDEASGRDLEWHLETLARFLDEGAGDPRPFALVVNFRDSHWPFPTDGAPFGAQPPAPHDPAQVQVPASLVDDPAVRQEIASYYDGLRRMDATVGALVRAVEARASERGTLVLFTSDNGPPYPFAKTTLYEAGIHMPLIAVGSGVEPGVDEHLVGLIDILPTLLELAGVAAPELDGRSLLPLLAGQEPSWREVLLASHTSHRMPPEVPSRALLFGNFKYIRNWSEGKRFSNLVMQTSVSWRVMQQRAGQDAELAARMQRFIHRPQEELYDLDADPEELHNLVNAPDQAARLAQARGYLRIEMQQQGDPLLEN